MNNNFRPGFVAGAILITIVMICSVMFQNDSWRDQIAKHGCAYYYLDSNNIRQWDWIKR